MISSLSKREKDALADIKSEISRKYRLCWMKLIGSKARGDFDEESDLDVVIVLDELNWEIEKDIYEICFYTGLKYDILISPIVYSDDKINNKLLQATPFYKVVEKEGLLI
jgi:predicted nucleotidyltransferase